MVTASTLDTWEALPNLEKKLEDYLNRHIRNGKTFSNSSKPHDYKQNFSDYMVSYHLRATGKEKSHTHV